MNCIAQSVARAIGCKPADVYIGVGHGEPIHVSEIVAWLLTQGYAAVPQPSRVSELDHFSGVIEGLDHAGSPHMVTVLEEHLILNITVVWYFVPVPINSEFVRRHNETLCMAS